MQVYSRFFYSLRIGAIVRKSPAAISVLASLLVSVLLTGLVDVGVASASTSGGQVDASFKNPRANDLVRVVVPLSDGKVLIAGTFTKVGGKRYSRVARLNANGSVDTSFHNRKIDGRVLAMVRQPSGKIVIAGEFTSVAGYSYGHVARLKADGRLDRSFGNLQTDSNVWALSMAGNGRFLVGGGFTSIDGRPVARLARINENGTLDTSFHDPGVGCCTVFTLARAAGGKILVGGEFTDVGGVSHVRIARLNSNGSLDSSFVSGSMDGSVLSIAPLADGRLIIGGGFSTVGGSRYVKVARLNANGSVDTTFRDPMVGTNPGQDVVDALQLLPNGKVMVGGDFSSVQGRNYRNFILLKASGALYSKFPNLKVNDHVSAIAYRPVQGQGKVFISGLFTKVSGKRHDRVVKLSVTN